MKIPDLEPVLADIPGFLGKISRQRWREQQQRTVSLPAAPHFPDARFANAIACSSPTSIKLIAEVKRASPTGHNADLNAVEAAQAFEAGGASAISVLTEPAHFHGTLEDLRAVTEAVRVPTMRKDFVVHPAMLQEAKDAGASAVLLIVAALKEHTQEFVRLCDGFGLDALVEIHTEAELELALDAGARLIGINNRDLHTLEINLGTAPRLGQLARQDDFEGPLVALSGYSTRAEARALEGLFDALLVGSSLAKSGDLTQATRTLLGQA